VAARAEYLIVNRQKCCALNLPAVRVFVRKVRRHLRLGQRQFNICFVDDQEIKRLNAAYRGKSHPTNVLSFRWQVGKGGALPHAVAGSKRRHGAGIEDSPPGVDELRNFLGDVVISTETARRHARVEGHSVLNEVRWLILHGVLHLLGYDHETDQGEMTERELCLREQLGIAGSRRKRRMKRRARARHG
jgi:probable rRNA maturation factor